MAYGKKTGGRQKGTPNKTTAFSKQVIQEIVSDYTNSENLMNELAALEPKERLDVMIKLMGFITPKPQSVDMTLTTEKVKTIEDTLAELSKENDV